MVFMNHALHFTYRAIRPLLHVIWWIIQPVWNFLDMTERLLNLLMFVSDIYFRVKIRVKKYARSALRLLFTYDDHWFKYPLELVRIVTPRPCWKDRPVSVIFSNDDWSNKFDLFMQLYWVNPTEETFYENGGFNFYDYEAVFGSIPLIVYQTDSLRESIASYATTIEYACTVSTGKSRTMKVSVNNQPPTRQLNMNVDFLPEIANL